MNVEGLGPPGSAKNEISTCVVVYSNPTLKDIHKPTVPGNYCTFLKFLSFFSFSGGRLTLVTGEVTGGDEASLGGLIETNRNKTQTIKT